MDEDRELDERSVPRDFDTLLQIAHRSEVPVPAGVAAAAFDRAFAQRRAGLWDGFVAGDDIDAGESYARAVEQFDALARGLTDREWHQPVATYGTVHNLVAHLLAIEIYTGKQLGLFDDDTISATAAATCRSVTRSSNACAPPITRRCWRRGMTTRGKSSMP